MGMSKNNGTIKIDDKTQLLINDIRREMARLQCRINDILTTVYNISGKEGDYKPDSNFTKLELVEKDKE
jgi:hypothetical protein